MKGTFITWMYDSRADWIAQRPSGVHVISNRYTNVGLEWMWRRMAGMVPDDLSQAQIVVGDGRTESTGGEEALVGENQSRAPLDEGFPEVIGSRIRFRATFGEREGIHEWHERGIVVPSGILVDRAVGDEGRKVFGSVWDVEAELELLPN